MFPSDETSVGYFLIVMGAYEQLIYTYTDCFVIFNYRPEQAYRAMVNVKQ
jgi:hypothetical protein